MTALTSILPSCSGTRYIAACVLRRSLSVYWCLSWPHAFWTKINRICKREFSGCPRKQVRSWLLPLQLATYLKDTEKAFANSSKKWVRKGKTIEAIKRYALTPKRRNSQRFLKYLYFNNFYSTWSFSQLILRIA